MTERAASKEYAARVRKTLTAAGQENRTPPGAKPGQEAIPAEGLTQESTGRRRGKARAGARRRAERKARKSKSGQGKQAHDAGAVERGRLGKFLAV